MYSMGITGLPVGGGGFNPFAAGSKRYGTGLLTGPNIGPVSGAGKIGYMERDLQAMARRNAILQRLKAQMLGNYASPAIGRRMY